MDFFESQDRARKKTTLLVVLFVLAVLSIIAMVYLAVHVTLGQLARGQPDSRVQVERSSRKFLDLNLLGMIGISTVVVVAGGSLFKIAQLRAGGRMIAEELGGRRLDPGSTEPAERKVLNVVEEMAIASGTPTPPVYFMDRESGINAFAAGYSPRDAVVGITRGSAERLTRDELQGVVAHEFSHILNGDMRLNIRLIGVVHGILIIGLIGYFLLRSALYSGAARRRSSKENPMPLIALGGALVVVGFLGTLFGNLIKSAVSRQREFLADAAAVQFTRNPDGIAGALKRIGGFKQGSHIENPNAPEASHMFFGQAFTSGLNAMFATHPPLPERIRRVDPSWKGEYPKAEAAIRPDKTHPRTDRTAGFDGNSGAEEEHALPAAIDQIGQPTEAHLEYASALIHKLPGPLLDAAHEPYRARAVVYGLLVDTDAEARRIQIEQLAQQADHGVFEETRRLLPLTERLERTARLPLVDMAMPALRGLSPEQHRQFMRNVDTLARVDEKIDLFEWTLLQILHRHLTPQFQDVKPSRIKHHTWPSLRVHARILISALAFVGHQDAAATTRAFDQAVARTPLGDLRILDRESCGLDAVDSALDVLDAAAPRLKREVLTACAICVSADKRITANEAELIRAIADTLGCPIPPLLPGQVLV